MCFNWYRHHGHDPRPGRRLRPDRRERRVRGRRSTTTPRSGSTASCRTRSATPAGTVVAGFNAPNRVLLTDDARPGQRFQIAVFGINGPISASPHNYIWMRTATLDFYAPERARAGGRRRARTSTASTPRWTRSSRRTRRSSGSPAASCSPRARCGAPTDALLFSSPNTNAIYRWHPSGRVTVFRSKSGYTGTDIGRYQPTRVERPDLRPAGPTDDLPARQPPRDPRRAARQRHRARRPLRRPAAEQPQRPRLPLRRHAVLHRPAVRAPRSVRRPRQGAAVQRRVRRPRRRRSRWSPTSSRGRTDSPSRPTSATCTSATGTPSARSSCATSSTATTRRSASQVLFDMTDADGRGRDRRAQGRPGRQRLRLRARRHLDHLARRRTSRNAPPARATAQPRLGRR